MEMWMYVNESFMQEKTYPLVHMNSSRMSGHFDGS